MERCGLEAGLPENFVEFDDTQARDLAEAPGERGFACGSGTKNEYALHLFQGSVSAFAAGELDFSIFLYFFFEFRVLWLLLSAAASPLSLQ